MAVIIGPIFRKTGLSSIILALRYAVSTFIFMMCGPSLAVIAIVTNTAAVEIVGDEITSRV